MKKPGILFLVFSAVSLFFVSDAVSEKSFPKPDEVKAVYLGTDNIFSKTKISELERMLAATRANGIVIDFKDSNALSQSYMAELVKRFKRQNVYTIARIVVFQDSYFAKKHPEIAVKTLSGALWYSGLPKWRRYWLDPASSLVQDYNIEVAKRAVDAGFDEIQFDYIRFPTDGNMRDIYFPVFRESAQTKGEVMEQFFKKIHKNLKSYAPQVMLSIDVFGEVFVYGRERGIGQDLSHVAQYFDVLSPMAYPSHYRCGEFKVQDPTANPYVVYFETLRKGIGFLGGRKTIIRPWIQDFTIPSIYGCGIKGRPVVYTSAKVRDQIRAGSDLGIHGFMLWNVRSDFTVEAFN